MEAVFEGINSVFGFIGPLSDFLWDFPTNFAWYADIPILGSFSFAIILLLGSGIFFSFKLGFMQVTHFKKAIKILTEKRSVADIQGEKRRGVCRRSAFLWKKAAGK